MRTLNLTKKRRKYIMVNAWSLAYEELYGDMDKEYPIMKLKEDELELSTSYNELTVLGGEDTISADYPSSIYGADTVSFVGAGEDQLSFSATYNWEEDGYSVTGNPCPSPDTLNFGSVISGGLGDDHISLGYDRSYDPYPTVGNLVSDSQAKPLPDLSSEQTQKYGEDKGIKDLKDYVSSTYRGHYTSNNNSVQTLDLIHSVGDAESFCRSNAIKYLSRYDKKGMAKQDILKAMHYCLLLYYFSGQTNETPTRGYETF